MLSREMGRELKREMCISGVESAKRLLYMLFRKDYGIRANDTFLQGLTSTYPI